MSYHVTIVGRDKAKLKAAILEHQCKDEVNAPHNGVPGWVCERLAQEVDRSRLYEYTGRVYGLRIEASGSFHESGANHSYTVSTIQVAE